MDYLKRASDSGHVLSEFVYGICCGYAAEAFGECLEFGFGTPIDLVLACEYYRRAGESGDALGALNYGRCLLHGKGIESDPELAVEYYRRSAERGNHFGELNYGLCLVLGKGTKSDVGLAAEYYRRSAQGGNHFGELNSGLCLQYGKGTPIDLKRAVEYYRRASATLPRALHHLRQCLTQCIELPIAESNPDTPNGDETVFANADVGLASRTEFRKSAELDTRNQRPQDPGRNTSAESDGRTTGNGHADGRPVGNRALRPIGFDRSSSLLVQEPYWSDSIVRLTHPCVLQIGGWPFSDAEIVAERVSLADVLDRANSGSSPTFWTVTGMALIMCGILLGMRFMQLMGIIHCELNPSNISIHRGHAAWPTHSSLSQR
jgi:hypothetical protein